MQLTEIRINLCPGHHPLSGGTAHPAARRGAVANSAVVAHPAANGHASANGLGGPSASRLRAFCSLTFDDTFVVRDVKLIDGNDGLFLAMPSRKLSDHCPSCREKNHLRARFCNHCGGRLDEHRHTPHRQAGTSGGHANGHGGGANARPKLHADVAHPINARCRHDIERRAVEAYWREVERSRQPGYVPPSLDHEDFDLYDARPELAAAEAVAHLEVAMPVGSAVSVGENPMVDRHGAESYPGHLHAATIGWQPATAAH